MRIRPNKDMSSCVLSSELQGMFGFAVLHILTKETKAPWRFRAGATVLCNTQQQFFLFFTSSHEQTIFDLLPFIVVAFLLMPALQMRHSYYYGMHTCVQHCVLYVTLDWFHDKWHICVRAVFYRVYQRQGRPEKALSQCERALELLQEGAPLSQSCCVYRNMAAIEQAQGHLDRAIEHLLQVNTAGIILVQSFRELHCTEIILKQMN